MRRIAVLLLLIPLAALAAPERRSRPRHAETPAPSSPGRFWKWKFAGVAFRGRMYAGPQSQRRITTAREFAELLNGEGSPRDARAFFETVDYSALNDECGPRPGNQAIDADPAIAPRELATRPSIRSTGRIAPFLGGYVVERFGRKVNGGWQRYRVFVAPQIYLVEKWD